jgi:hypothetical protein
MFLSSRYLHSWILTPVLVSSWLLFGSALLNHRNSPVVAEDNPLVAVDDSYTVHGQGTLSPLVNDYDTAGNPFYWWSLTQPQHGSVSTTSSTTLGYSAASGYVGSDSFTYTIRDSAGNFATATITITDVNQFPVAVTDFYTVHGQASFYPAANDYDPDNDGVSFKVLATNPQHGSVVVNPDGLCGYTATYGYTGPDSFTYKIQDGWGAISTGTVNISVVNQPPVAVPDFYVWQSGRHLIPAQNDFDPEGDGAYFNNITSNPQHGTLTGVAYGIYVYSPNAGFSGFDSFTYSIFDGYGAVSSGTVFLFVTQDSTTSLPPERCACPDDPAGASSFNPGAGGLRTTSTGSAGKGGPQANDPVNLATGSETYTPDPDLTI